ncbi:hypothetical protein [Myxococcus xanthus]|uniref:hypothetical protein n=1 Tax=Myxococcus xanthus TaxID=34 RepID=UPI001162A91E|nr:hypothetical protein [Myxococcus xanthus]QDE83290.1 hypothetical protein BHS07_17970 [Myxococcus xanthus]
MTLPEWLVTAVAYAVISTGAAYLLSVCLSISIALLEHALRCLGLWRDVAMALFVVWAQRKKGKRT